ncbi:hypothetical protein GCM10027168_25010 [Streptomyces capparidis]
MSEAERKRACLREAMRRGRLALAAGVHDGLGARLAQEAGFDVLWVSGLGVSAAHAVPDESILTMTEFLAAARSVNEASHLPALADCDTGFGDEANVARMVDQYERAGIAGVCIEDKVFPKRNSLGDGEQVMESVAGFCRKIRAAKRAQSGEGFVVIARTETFITGGTFEQAAERADAYVDAGADGILIHSRSQDGEEVLDFARRWGRKDVPLVAVPTTYPQVTSAELHRAGFSLCIYANQAVRASVTAMRSTLGEIREHGCSVSVERRIARLKELFALQVPQRSPAPGAAASPGAAGTAGAEAPARADGTPTALTP